MSTYQHAKHPLPGDLAIWIFILAELGVFGVLFITFSVVRTLHPEIFADGHAHLNRVAGLINTGALITASYFVVMGVLNIKKNNSSKCTLWLIAAIASASVYVFVKAWEYGESAEAGYRLSTNIFYMFYYILTFFHFAHVLLGMIILTVLAVNCHRGKYCEKEHAGIESGASYWHMVDLVWIVLFPLVYVIH